jgi:MinD superfamily P-loop ATPase
MKERRRETPFAFSCNKKGESMNKGTKIRTLLAVLTTINTVLAVTDITQFGNEKLNLAYKVASVIVNALVVGINTYFNQDYTEEACVGTAITRQLKAEQREDYIGEYFFTEPTEGGEQNESNDL